MSRDYGSEYRNYQGKPRQIKRRAERNASRNKLVQKGLAKKGDGKDVHHKDGNTANKSLSNLSIMSKSKNRSRKV